MKDSKINEDKFDKFINDFNNKIFPTIVGDDGKGAKLFRDYIEKKRLNVEISKEKRRILSEKK